MQNVTLSQRKAVSTVTKLAALSGYSRVQIYRLLKKGTFLLGDASAYRWAMKVRHGSGLGTVTGSDWYSASKRVDGRGRDARSRAGGPRLNSKACRDHSKKYAFLLSEKHLAMFEELDAIQKKRPIFVTLHVAGALGVPVNLDTAEEPSGEVIRSTDGSTNDYQPDEQRVDIRRTIEQAARMGYHRKDGKRWSGKRKSFSQIQLLVNEVFRSGEVATYSTVAQRLKVSRSTLWRWVNEGHLKQFRCQLTPWAGTGGPGLDQLSFSR